MKRIAVALIQGAEGAGKSTLAKAQFARRGARRMARLEVRSSADVGAGIGHLVAGSPVDHVIVEVSREVRDPLTTGRYALQSTHVGAQTRGLEYACVASVVDSTCFLRDLVSEVHVSAGGFVRVESRAMALSRQVEASDVIVVSKTDLVSPTTLSVLLAVLSELNPWARVVIAQHGHAPSFDLFDRSPIELAQALRGVSRKDVLDHTARERAAAGISSYVYRARRPFHPERLHAHVHQPWPGVLRSRGLFWLATRMDEAGVWSQAGSTWETSRGGLWSSAPDRRGLPSSPSAESTMAGDGREQWGERRQELTLIGLEMDTRALKDAFDACLLSPDEAAAGIDEWLELSDPFPSWSASIPEEAAAAQPSSPRPSVE